MNEIKNELSFFPFRNVFGKSRKYSDCYPIQVACWLLDPDSKEPTLHSIVSHFLPHELPLLEEIETGQGIQSLGLNVSTTHSGRYRASVESILIFNSMNQLNSLLKKENLQGKKNSSWHFYDVVRLGIVLYLATLSQVDKLHFFFLNRSYTFYADPFFWLSSAGVNINNFAVKGQIVTSFGFVG